ncbi:MAG: hypothetical protein J6D53_04430 [Blautia sp.]|nr:hypothetical protein [Blautia sp.]
MSKKKKQNINETGAQIKEEVQETKAQVKEEIQETKASVKEEVQATKTQIKEEVQESKSQIKEEVQGAGAQFKESIQETGTGIKESIQETGAGIKEGIQETGNEIKENVQKAGDQVKAQQKKIADNAKEKASKIKNGAVQQTIRFRDGAKEMSDDLKKLLAKEIFEMKNREKRRSAEMISIFARHNFYAGGFTPVELRTTLEDLGPTYVKIGQIMSSRVDMLPESYCKELEKLRQNVKPLDSEVVRAVIEQETGKKIEEIYSEFDDTPLGAASIGQVHRATLLDGTKVVTKVQRPLIADMMRKDFVLLKKLATGLKIINEGNEDQGEQIDLLAVLEELEKVEDEELDFRVEARNTIFFKENCIEDETKVTCPTIYEDLTTERMMTSTFVDGYSVSKKDKIAEDGFDVNVIGEAILDNYVHQVLDVGVFHADPHQGNIMVNREGIPTWIDFGMIGRLSESNIKMIQDLILSIINMDTEELANAALAMGAGGPKTDREKLSQDLDGLISKYMSVTNLEELDTAALLGEVMDIMSDNYIKIPGEYTMLVRSIATIEGVMEELCPDLNLFKIITDKLLERAKKSFDLQQSMISAGKDLLSVGKKASRIPSLASDALNSVIKGRTKIKFELTGYEPLMANLTETVKLCIFALFSCVLFFGSCILCMTNIEPKTVNGIPLLALIGFIFSIALAIYTVRKLSMLQNKK